MASPVASWNTVRVFGSWINGDGTRKAGKWKLVIPVRITNDPQDVIIPKWEDGGDLGISPSSPSLDIQVPAGDDPDNTPNGFTPILTITFLDGSDQEVYNLDVPVSKSGDLVGINLRKVFYPVTVPDAQAVKYIGVAGGIAKLDKDGDVINSDGQKVIGGSSLALGETSTTAYAGSKGKANADLLNQTIASQDIDHAGRPIGVQAEAFQPRGIFNDYWTRPLTKDAPLASTSTDYVARLKAQATMSKSTTPLTGYYDPPYNTTTHDRNDFSIPWYIVPEGTPRQPVYVTRPYKPTMSAVFAAGVPLPDATLMYDGKLAPNGSDKSIIIQKGWEMWEMWVFEASTQSGFSWQCGQGGYIADIRRHPGTFSSSSSFGGGSGGRPQGEDWGVRACGIAVASTVLTIDDFWADSINHPLALGIPIPAGTSLLPATRQDYQNISNTSNEIANNYRVPEGARFRLPWSFDIPSYVASKAVAAATTDPTGRTPNDGLRGGTAKTLEKLLRCLRDYGLIISDTAGVVALEGEGSKVAGTPYSPWAASEIPNWGNVCQQFPWDSFVQVAPPSIDFSIPKGSYSA